MTRKKKDWAQEKQIPFTPRKVRKIGRSSKAEKSFVCEICGAGSVSAKGIRQHNSFYHNGTEAERDERAERQRQSNKKRKAKSNVTAFSNQNDKKFDVFEGDLDQNDWIDSDEEDFVKVAKTQREQVKDYKGNIITVVPARLAKDGFSKFVQKNKTNPSVTGHIYIGTSAVSGACEIHQNGSRSGPSSVAKMLKEKNKQGQAKYKAFYHELTFDQGISSEDNQKLAWKWEAFFTYVGLGQKKTKDNKSRMQWKFLNVRVEAGQGEKAGLSIKQIKIARRLGRTNPVIFGEKKTLKGIQINFPLFDKNGENFRMFSSNF